MQQAQANQGFAVSAAPMAAMLPGQTADEMEIGAFDHFSTPTQIAIGAGIIGLGGAAGYAAYGLTSSALGGGVVVAEGATAAGFTGVIVAALPFVGGLLAAGAVSYGAYKAIEKLLGGPTVVTKTGVKKVLSKTDIDPALYAQISAEIEQATIARALKKSAKASKKASKTGGQQIGPMVAATA